MSEPREASDDLELKKRARRRLVGAVAFATFAAVVLPMVMDETPPPVGHDIDLRIPGPEQAISSPLTKGKPTPAQPPAEATKPTKVAATAPAEPPALPPAAAPAVVAEAAKSAGKPEVAPPTAKPAAKSAPAADPTKAESPAPAKAAADASADAKRAQGLLEGQGAAGATADPAAAHVVLIGAFANAANVKNLQVKLGELGIKTYTETLDSPQGRKTRVRAGPFPNRDAAEKALGKMKRIGVGGVVAAKS